MARVRRRQEDFSFGRRLLGRLLLAGLTAAALALAFGPDVFPDLDATADAAQPTQTPETRQRLLDCLREPHRLLAMAYKQDLASFAQLLARHCDGAGGPDQDFVQDTVGEMMRAFGEMKRQLGKHEQSLPQDLRPFLEASSEQTAQRLRELQSHLEAVSAQSQSAEPDHDKISSEIEQILYQCRRLD